MFRDALRIFMDNTDPDDWSEIAFNWVIAALVIAVVMCAMVMLYKGIRKMMAGDIKRKSWSRGETWLLIFVGLLPMILLMWSVWYMTSNFFDFVGMGGLLKGIVIAWLLYLFFMIAGHLASPWRREIF